MAFRRFGARHHGPMRSKWLKPRRGPCSGDVYDQDRYLFGPLAVKWSYVVTAQSWLLFSGLRGNPDSKLIFTTRIINPGRTRASSRLAPRAPGCALTAPHSRRPAVRCERRCEGCDRRLSPTCRLTCTRVTRVQVCRARHSATVCQWSLPVPCSAIVCRPAGLRCAPRALAVPSCASPPVSTPPCHLPPSRRRTL